MEPTSPKPGPTLPIQAMKPYIEIAEKTKADAMKLFETEMEKEE